MNYRVGDKAHHFMKGNMVGTVVAILNEGRSNVMSTGGSFESKTYIVLQYMDGSTEKIIKSDLIKVY